MPTSDLFRPYDTYLTPGPIRFFRDRIMDYVPEFYKDNYEGIYSIMQLVAPALDELYQYIINQTDLPDIDRCPARFLQLLSGNIGVERDLDFFREDQQLDFRRRELGKLKNSHEIRAVEYSFLRFVKYQGATEYGLIYPYKQLLVTDFSTLDGWSPKGERNDVDELLAPQWFDLSGLPDGGYDQNGELQGSRVIYHLPINVVRSEVRMVWNDVEISQDTQHPEGEIDYTFYFNRNNDTIVTNFVPLIGDRLRLLVVGDPFYGVGCRINDAWYWRSGVTEIWAVDVNPIDRRVPLEDRRPIGSLLYFAWILRFFQTKCFPFPPDIDYHRHGYEPPLAPEPTLPIHQDLTWDSHTPCDREDPLWFQIINGYGFEAQYQIGGELDYTLSLPFNGEFAIHPEWFMSIIDDTNSFFASQGRTAQFKITLGV